MAALIDSAKRALTRAFSSRDDLVQQLRELERPPADDAAVALANAIEEARADVERWEEPRRRLERLERELRDRNAHAYRAAELVRHELRETTPRQLVAFERWLARIRPLLRPVPAEVVTNHVTDQVVIRNLTEVQAGERAIATLHEAEIACRDLLWRLPEAELRVKIQEFRERISRDLGDEMLEGELTAGRLGGF
jgi:hypothetical protein